jgi:hypothetical protein
MPWLTACVVALVGLWSAAPGLGWLDAGDFVTASAQLGVPHATGFPWQTQASYLFALIPASSIATRVSWWSVAGMAVAAFAWVELLRAAARDRTGLPSPAVTGAMSVATIGAMLATPTLAVHLRVPEVYAWVLGIAGLSVLWFDRWVRTARHAADLRWVALLGFALGLGIAHHALFRLWAPLTALAAVAAAPPALRRRAALLGISFGLFGLLAWAYLPAAALRDGPHNWGDPSSPLRFWRVIQASEIREAFGSQMGADLSVATRHLGELLRQLVGGLPALVIVGLVGLFARLGGARRGASAGLRLALAFATIELCYAVLLNPMGIRDLQVGQWLALVLAPLAVLDLHAVSSRVLRRHAGPWVLGLSTALCAGAAFMPPDPRAEAAPRDRAPEDLAAAVAGAAPPEAVVLPVSDSLTAALLHAWHVADARPDAFLVGRSGSSRSDHYRYAERHQPFALVAPGDPAFEPPFARTPDEIRARMTSLAMAAAPGHRIWWERMTRDPDVPTGWRLSSCWPMGELTPADLAPCPEQRQLAATPPFDAAWGRAAREASGAASQSYAAWLSEQHGAAGMDAAGRNDLPAAGASFARANELFVTATMTSNVAVILGRMGRLTEALEQLEAAWRLSPGSTTACRNGFAFAQAAHDPVATATWRERCQAVQAAP